jgi:hypothetical protein
MKIRQIRQRAKISIRYRSYGKSGRQYTRDIDKVRQANLELLAHTPPTQSLLSSKHYCAPTPNMLECDPTIFQGTNQVFLYRTNRHW